MKRVAKYLVRIIIGVFILFAGFFSFFSQNYNQAFIQPLLAERSIQSNPVDLQIVLGASLKKDGTLTDLAMERVDRAIADYKETGKDILFSGGDTPYGVEAIVMDEYAKANGYEGVDHIEGSSTSTYENAYFSDMLLDEASERLDSNVLLVVTSPFHSRRSLATFSQLMPERTIYIDYPDTSVILDNSVLGRWKGLRMILREYLAIEWYKLHHGINL